MKTSNKLISLGLIILLLGGITLLVKAKSSMVDKADQIDNDIIEELNNKIEEGDDDIIQRSLGSLSASKLKLDGNHRYILDPTTNEVTVTGPQGIVNDFEEIGDEKFFDAPIYTEVTTKQDERNSSKVFDRITEMLYYNIGVRDCKSLLLVIGNESKVTAAEPLQLERFDIQMEGSSHIDAEVNCITLELRSRDTGHAELHGTVNLANISLDDNSNAKCYGLTTQDADVILNDNSRLELKVVAQISGLIKNNAYYGNAEKIDIGNLIVTDNARVDNR